MVRLLAATGIGFALSCANSSTSPTPPAPTPSTSSLAVTFDENPVPFRSSGCSFSIPQGWFTQARVRETGGVTFTPTTLTQKIDGNVASVLTESFNSRFGACSGVAFTADTISANGAVCGVVGVCAVSSFSTYQFSMAGTDANGHTLTFDSPVLQLGARPTGQSIILSLEIHR